MITTHSLGYPRIGKHRELKFALESYWKQEITADKLHEMATMLRRAHWFEQSTLDLVPLGDFSLYDHVLDMSFLLGNIPSRFGSSEDLDAYFLAARGQSAATGHAHCCGSLVVASEMTKWFDTNYHYIVPEFGEETTFELRPQRLLEQVKDAVELGVDFKPVLIGPLTYLALGKSRDGVPPLKLLDGLLPVYQQLLDLLHEHGANWVQLDEPILVTELDQAWQFAFNKAYHQLKTCKARILVATYFGRLKENAYLASQLPVAGLHVDVASNRDDLQPLLNLLPSHKVLSLGVVNGRNVWKTDLSAALEWLEPVAQKIKERLWLAPSCSLLHVPMDLEQESGMDDEIRCRLSFARQKIEEVGILATALSQGRQAVQDELDRNRQSLAAIGKRSGQNPVKDSDNAPEGTGILSFYRKTPWAERYELQKQRLGLPVLPTTTIGSFPQTAHIRQQRRLYKEGRVSWQEYEASMQAEIAECIRIQEEIGLDVLVHGEAERNDMVEYFAEKLEGFAVSCHGWVQSYGSRCVKPPIIYGDIERRQPLTVQWTTFAQSLTQKPVKGMLTGPVTMLNWSFVREDQPRSLTCWQLAKAVRDEIQDLESAGIAIIQVDEAALREGLPLRRSEWTSYLDWATECFRAAVKDVKDETQIHTHMCYSEFNDILDAISSLDADVITIEASRSRMDLLDAFKAFDYPNAIGPGVYDIHSPNVPSVSTIVQRLEAAMAYIPLDRLWVNPDCGLKTRQWSEVAAALKNMVEAARDLRKKSSP